MSVIIVTGASRGIGRETVITLKNKAYNVVGTYLNSTESAKMIESEYKIPFIRCDVSSQSDVENLFDFAKRKYGKISAVISNAGIALNQKPFIDATSQEMDKLISVNLKGAMLVNKCAVLSMLSSGGKIINVSSVFALKGGACEVLYSAVKAGVIGLTKSLADELSYSDISVCAVAPGLIDTDMNAHLSKEDKEGFLQDCNLKKIATPLMVAEEICKILNSDDINGKVYPLFTGDFLKE